MSLATRFASCRSLLVSRSHRSIAAVDTCYSRGAWAVAHLPASFQNSTPNVAYENVSGSSANLDVGISSFLFGVGGGLCSLMALQSHADVQADAPNQNGSYSIAPEDQELINWSGTHTVATHRYYLPENLQQLKGIVEDSHRNGRKLRPVGSGLSPNALGFSAAGMVNLALMDSILSIDHETRRVKVQAGARVGQVVEALRPHGLTLQNFASIMEQQVGGFTQVSAHGTGAAVPPVDEQVVGIKLVTPGAGEVDLSVEDEDPSLFKLARASLGLLGIVAELTLQCVPAHFLVERTFTTSREEVRKNHANWLRQNRHLRYMWIPLTDDVVVVTCNPVSPEYAASLDNIAETSTEAYRLEPVRNLLKSTGHCPKELGNMDELSFTALRDALLSINPLDIKWVRRVNEVEAEYWKRSEGIRIDMSDRVLGFDCGGQQWVSEVAVPVQESSALDDSTKPSHADIEFVENILELIERENIPAPAPIEQRWTASSSSPLSPAFEPPNGDRPQMYSWVGIIMYLPQIYNANEENSSSDTNQALLSKRQAVTDAFFAYKQSCEKHLWDKARAVEHWAKIEVPKDERELVRLRARIAKRYPTVAFNAIRELFDPRGILSNDVTDAIFGKIVSDIDSRET